jgi:hypothetical protein
MSRFSKCLGFTSALLICSAMHAQISNGISGDGELTVPVDNMGAWYTNFNTGAGMGEVFDPAGAPGGDFPTFSVGTFIFVSNTHRELLAEHAPWQATSGNGGPFGSDASLITIILSPNSYADWMYGDGMNDTAMSEIRVAGIGVNLHIDIVNAVRRASDTNVAFMIQKYTIRNDDASSVTFKLHRAWDADMYWRTGSGTDYANDQVGAGMSGGHRYARQGEVGMPSTTVCLSGIDAPDSYHGAKQGHTPTGGGPAMGFGTDNITWNNYGTPPSWMNYVAYLGYNMDGVSTDVTNQDAHIALEYTITLGAGESREVYLVHTYGATAPAICNIADVNGDGTVDDADLLIVLFNFGGVGDGDANLDGVADDADLLLVLFSFGDAC